jgi:hypothetical protein
VAKTMRRDHTWGDVPSDASQLAHQGTKLDCYSCHTSWVASCFGCHLDMKANQKREALHFEGNTQRNWTTYSFQTLRDDIFMLGKDGDVTGGRAVPVRSACAVTVGSQNQNREFVYSQQQTISAEGLSGTAFSPHFPHTDAQDRDPDLHRLPPEQGGRQRGPRGPGAHARHERRELPRPLRLHGVRRGGLRRRRRHRARRAPGRLREPAPRAGLPRPLREHHAGGQAS